MRDIVYQERRKVKLTKGLAVFECQDDNTHHKGGKEMNRNAPDTI